nr:tyrosine-type recombinase/integrase [Liquorilactobacillus uvarum]
MHTTLNDNSTSKYMIMFAIYSGARLNEIQTLTWKSLNFKFKTMTINKS